MPQRTDVRKASNTRRASSQSPQKTKPQRFKRQKSAAALGGKIPNAKEPSSKNQPRPPGRGSFWDLSVWPLGFFWVCFSFAFVGEARFIGV
jgi:hypothetical protein